MSLEKQKVTIDLYKVQADFAQAQRRDAEAVAGICGLLMEQSARVEELEKENASLRNALATRAAVQTEGAVAGPGES